MPRWDIAQTRSLVSAEFGVAQVERMRHCLRSVCERQRHARFHFQEARRLMQGHIDARLPHESIYQITWPTQAKDRIAFDNCFMKVEAHVIACAQATHALADNLAHVAYFALGVNLSPHALGESQVTLHRVISVLAAHFRLCDAVTEVLRELTAESAFQSIDAFVNTTKHRGFAETRISVDPDDGQIPYKLEFGSFEYRETTHPERDIEKVLLPSYAKVSQAVVCCGNAINAVLFSSYARSLRSSGLAPQLKP